MPNNSICASPSPARSLTYVEAQTTSTTKRFVLDNSNKLVYLLQDTRNGANSDFALKNLTRKEIEKIGITFIDKIIHCSGEITKEPHLANAIIGQYNTTSSLPNRFRAITDLNHTEKSNYKQLSNLKATETLRCELLSLIDEDLKDKFSLILKEWGTYGVSVNTVDQSAYSAFKGFYDDVMASHAVTKEDYAKVDFGAQNIKPHITDLRCLDAKLTPLQLFKAAFQLGDIPAVSNFRFMDNPASKDDGKYREWMFHVDNSNYDAEYKIITTRKTDTLSANEEQCLAAFPYDTTQSIRFTKSEAATKFPTLESLEKEFRNVPGARYVVIKNPHDNTPLEAGIRTEMIAHHRSASDKTGPDSGESRSAELMTFHGLGRCQPFLSPQELEQATHLTPLQNFVLGGFRNSAPEKFLEHLAREKQTLNAQLRNLLEKNAIKSLDDITAAIFTPEGTTVTNPQLFKKQMETYDNLPEIINKIPRLTQDDPSQKTTVLKIVPMLMNFDQNAELKPDCSENKAFPARTQIRERTNEDFHTPLRRDLEQVQFNIDPKYLLPMDKLIGITRNIQDFYVDHASKFKLLQPNSKLLNLLESRAELAKEYITQLPSRATLPETHQTLSLFIYYMIDDLDETRKILTENGVDINNALLDNINNEQHRILQHFITYRLLNDSTAPE